MESRSKTRSAGASRASSESEGSTGSGSGNGNSAKAGRSSRSSSKKKAEDEKKQQSEAVPEVAEVEGKSPPPVPPVDKVVVARKHPGVFMETSELVEETGVQGCNSVTCRDLVRRCLRFALKLE